MLNKLERKFGKYAISNLTLYMIFTYILGYLLVIIAPNLVDFILLDMSKVAQGQVWRLITWIFTPPTSLSIFTIITLYFYYCIGKVLEKTMGDFVYNLYIFSGIFLTIIASVLVYVIPPLFGGRAQLVTPSTYYLCMSIYLAFALSFPETRVYLFFIIPIKMKWLAYLDIAYLILAFYNGTLGVRVMVVASILNFIIYFFFGRQGHHLKPSEIKRRQEFKAQVKEHTSITRHRCHICGRTERDGDLTFRYCSKCNGNFEYCSDHIYTHEHIK